MGVGMVTMAVVFGHGMVILVQYFTHFDDGRTVETSYAGAMDDMDYMDAMDYMDGMEACHAWVTAMDG
jgi:hypothetical protein